MSLHTALLCIKDRDFNQNYSLFHIIGKSQTLHCFDIHALIEFLGFRDFIH